MYLWRRLTSAVRVFERNGVDAILYRMEDKNNPLFTVSGQWNNQIMIQEGDGSAEIETIDVYSLTSTPMLIESEEEQDNWESRKALAGVITALDEGDMQKTVEEK